MVVLTRSKYSRKTRLKMCFVNTKMIFVMSCTSIRFHALYVDRLYHIYKYTVLICFRLLIN